MKKKLKQFGFSILKKNLSFHLKLFLGMFMLFFLWTSPVMASGQVRVTLNLKSVSIDEAIDNVEKIVGKSFFFNREQINSTKNINVELKEAGLAETVEAIFGKEYSFRETDKLIIITPGEVQSQQQIVRIKGIVYTKQKESLPGASVRIKNTNYGVSTGINGEFELNIPYMENIILVVSFVGMETQEIAFTGQEEIRVYLQDAITEIGEVVVTGIFNKPRESYTGSVTTVTSKELKRAGNRSILTSLRNIDPSFNIMENIEMGSNPNHIPDITIRGNSSIPNNSVRAIQEETRSTVNLPLFIKDGFEISLSNMMDLDEDQIETITILKDASATAMYGTRGANGVIVIITKMPEGGRLRISYTGNLNLEIPDLRSYNLLNAREKLEYEVLAGLYSYPGLPDQEQQLIELYHHRLNEVARGVDTWWLKYPLRTGTGHRHSLRLEGGREEFRYAIGIGYNDVEGVMKDSDRKTFNGNTFLSYRYKNILFQNDLQISVNRAHNSPYGTFSDYTGINAYYKPYDDEGNLIKQLESFSYYNLLNRREDRAVQSNVYNPLFNALLPSINESRYTEIRNNFAIEWTVLPELILRGSFGISTVNNRSDLYKSSLHTEFDNYTGDNIGRKGSYVYGTGETYAYTGNLRANYNKTFGERHQLYAGLGIDVAEDNYETYSFKAEGISNPNMAFLGMAALYEENGSPYGDDGLSRRVGGILNLNYTYNNRYFVDFVGTAEGSSKFGSNNRLAPFWSVGTGWNIHRENFVEANDWMDVFRLRLSYGISGLQDFNPYQAFMTYRAYGSTHYNGWYGSELIAMGNKDLGWQKTGQLNIGTDIELFNSRLRLTFDFYNKLTNDLLSDITLPAAGGFQTYIANIGKILNRGFEVGASAYIIRDTERQIVWSVGGNFLYNKNRIKEISNSLEMLNDELLQENSSNPSFLLKEGQSINTIFAVPSLGIDPSNGKEIFVKQDGSLTYDWDAKDKMPCGVAEPKYWGNLNTLFRYRNLNLNMIFSYRLGGQMYNYTLVNKVENINPYGNVDKRALYDRWQQPGDKAFFKSIEDLSTTKASSRFVMDENTFECKTIQLSYDVESKWISENLGVSYLTVAGTMEDVFRISTIKQERGLSYPFARKFAFSVTVRF